MGTNIEHGEHIRVPKQPTINKYVSQSERLVKFDRASPRLNHDEGSVKCTQKWNLRSRVDLATKANGQCGKTDRDDKRNEGQNGPTAMTSGRKCYGIGLTYRNLTPPNR